MIFVSDEKLWRLRQKVLLGRILLRFGRTPMARSDLIILLASPVVGRHMFPSFRGRFSDP